MRLFIGASSSENIPDEYMEDCIIMLESILKENDLVFGAYNKGLMGMAYEIAKKNEKHITGICPDMYKEGLKDLSCDEEIITNSILDSTMKICQRSDAIIILPGGFGSIYEFFTANYLKICKEIDVPIILYNSLGYYNQLLSFMGDSKAKGFMKESEFGHFKVASNNVEVLECIHEEGTFGEN